MFAVLRRCVYWRSVCAVVADVRFGYTAGRTAYVAGMTCAVCTHVFVCLMRLVMMRTGGGCFRVYGSAVLGLVCSRDAAWRIDQSPTGTCQPHSTVLDGGSWALTHATGTFAAMLLFAVRMFNLFSYFVVESAVARRWCAGARLAIAAVA